MRETMILSTPMSLFGLLALLLGGDEDPDIEWKARKKEKWDAEGNSREEDKLAK